MAKVCKSKIGTLKEHCLKNSYDTISHGHTLAPWACIRFESINGKYKSGVISVGNRSSTVTEPKNAAAIKSLEFGQEDGFTVRVVVHDQQGGAFDTFMTHFLKDWKELKVSPTTVKMRFQFGWTKAGCESSVPYESSPPFFAFLDQIETSYMEGKFIAEVTGNSTGQLSREGSTECLFGEDGSKNSMYLKNAIEELMINSKVPPTVENVEFVKLVFNKKGEVTKKPCGFKEFDKSSGLSKKEAKLLGPKETWKCNSLDKLHVVHTWLKDHPTEEDKAWRVAFDPTKKGEHMIIFQNEPECIVAPKFCIGRYVINGGADSPVLEFNPKIKWDFASLQSVGGGSSGETSAPKENEEGEKKSKTTGVKDCVELSRNNSPGAGQMNQFITPQGMKNIYGENATSISYDHQSKHMFANMHGLYHHDIEADLVIVGDPSFINPWLLIQKTVTIDFINPFYISKAEGIRCGEWLAKPPLNEYLSSDGWRIEGVSHKIELGSFTTTLRVKLTRGDFGV